MLNRLHKQPNPKHKLFNHVQELIPNRVHEVDLLEMPNDSGFRYILSVVDRSSRYKGAYKLRNKTASSVVEAYRRILAQSKLKLPYMVYSDMGAEFMGAFTKYLADNNVRHTRKQPGDHLPFVEAWNRILAKDLFRFQQEIELKTGKLSKIWIRNLQNVVDKRNDTVTRMINMKPNDAIDKKIVKLADSVKPDETDTEMFHPIGTRVRYLLKKDQVQIDPASSKITIEKRRATDYLWSKDVYIVSALLSVHIKDQLIMHRLDGIPAVDRLFNYWQLQPEIDE